MPQAQLKFPSYIEQYFKFRNSIDSIKQISEDKFNSTTDKGADLAKSDLLALQPKDLKIISKSGSVDKPEKKPEAFKTVDFSDKMFDGLRDEDRERTEFEGIRVIEQTKALTSTSKCLSIWTKGPRNPTKRWTPLSFTFLPLLNSTCTSTSARLVMSINQYGPNTVRTAASVWPHSTITASGLATVSVNITDPSTSFSSTHNSSRSAYWSSVLLPHLKDRTPW